MGLFSFLTQEIAIDLGTANTIIIHDDKIVVDEPSIVAVDKNTGKKFNFSVPVMTNKLQSSDPGFTKGAIVTL